MASGKYKEGERPTPEEVLLALCREVLETEAPGGGSDRVRAFCDMVFHVCSECKERRLLTADGPVEVTEEYLKGFEGSARKMEIPFEEEYVKGEPLPEGEIAGELPAELAGKVLALAGRCCAHCGRKLGIHIHHVIFRRNGGTNEILNLLCVCALCRYRHKAHYADFRIMPSWRISAMWDKHFGRSYSA
jgi:hypothetical protein